MRDMCLGCPFYGNHANMDGDIGEGGRGVFYRGRFHDAADIWQRRERGRRDGAAGRREQKVSAVQSIICIYAR